MRRPHLVTDHDALELMGAGEIRARSTAGKPCDKQLMRIAVSLSVASAWPFFARGGAQRRNASSYSPYPTPSPLPHPYPSPQPFPSPHPFPFPPPLPPPLPFPFPHPLPSPQIVYTSSRFPNTISPVGNRTNEDSRRPTKCPTPISTMTKPGARQSAPIARAGGCQAEPGTYRPVVDRTRCEGKSDCVEVCPHGVFEVRRIDDADFAGLSLLGRLKSIAHGRKTAYTPAAEKCQACGLCVVACPEKAITLAR